jgi:TRAP-type C4-dicarboxylate transport system permease large subunit
MYRASGAVIIHIPSMYIICKHNEVDNMFYTTAGLMFTNTDMIGVHTPPVSFPI